MGENRLDNSDEMTHMSVKEATKLLETMDGLYKMLEMADLVAQSAANRLDGKLLKRVITIKETISAAKINVQRCWAELKTLIYGEQTKH